MFCLQKTVYNYLIQKDVHRIYQQMFYNVSKINFLEIHTSMNSLNFFLDRHILPHLTIGEIL